MPVHGSGRAASERLELPWGPLPLSPFKAVLSRGREEEVEQGGGLGRKVGRVKPVWLLVFIVNFTGCRITIETALGVTMQVFLGRF